MKNKKKDIKKEKLGIRVTRRIDAGERKKERKKERISEIESKIRCSRKKERKKERKKGINK